MNAIIESYKKALHEIMTTDEIDKVYKYTKSRRERNTIKRIKESYTPDLPFIATLPVVAECPLLISNVITYMIINAEEKENGNGE